MTKGAALVLVVVVGATACGDAIDSGVDDDKRASDLTPEEYGRVCQAISDGVANSTSPERQHELSCRVRGFIAGAVANVVSDSTSTIRAACQENYDECVAEGPGPNVMATMLDCSGTSTTCDVTVGEIEKCGNDTLAWVEDVRARYPTCNQLNANSFGENAAQSEAPQRPTSCDVFQRC